MKPQITLIAALSASLSVASFFGVFGIPEERYMTLRNPLPIQAAVSDVIGICTPVTRTNGTLFVDVSQYWLNAI